jgi:hypothetical protein
MVAVLDGCCFVSQLFVSHLGEEGDMGRFLGLVGNVSAIVGVLLAFGAGIARIMGMYLVSGYTTMTLFQVGTGLMVLACLCKLEAIQSH